MPSFLKGDFSAVLQQLTIKVQLNESNQTKPKKVRKGEGRIWKEKHYVFFTCKLVNDYARRGRNCMIRSDKKKDEMHVT